MPPYRTVQGIQKKMNNKHPSSLKESIYITFIVNGPLVFESLEDKQTKKR